MFNREFLVPLLILITFYIVQTLIIILALIYWGSKTFNKETPISLKFANNTLYYLISFIMFSFAGIPPFFIFFFKIIIFLKLKTSLPATIAYIVVNTCLIYYYINVFLKLNVGKEYSFINFNVQLIRIFLSLLLHVILFSVFGFLLIQYIIDLLI